MVAFKSQEPEETPSKVLLDGQDTLTTIITAALTKQVAIIECVRKSDPEKNRIAVVALRFTDPSDGVEKYLPLSILLSPEDPYKDLEPVRESESKDK